MSGSHCILYCGKQGIQIVRAVMTDTIDEECRCAIHTTLNTTVDIFSNAFNNSRVVPMLYEFGPVETESHRISYKINVIEPVLILEESVMHLPELTLPASGFCSLSSLLSMRMYLRQREVTIGET